MPAYFEAVSGLTQEQFVKDLQSSYASVHDTVVHIIWAEWLWLQRWKATSPQSVFQTTDFTRPDARPESALVRGRGRAESFPSIL